MDFSAKLENLQAKVNETVETARAAAAENRDQLKQRVDKAQDDANQAMGDAKQQAQVTADRAKSKWAEMKADAAARRERISRRRSTSGPISWTPRPPLPTRTGPRTTRPTPSTTPSGWSTTRSWPCSTRWTRGPTQTNGPGSPARRSARWQIAIAARHPHRRSYSCQAARTIGCLAWRSGRR
jgi:hypothetical protein